jgi:serine/threonine-protein kinase
MDCPSDEQFYDWIFDDGGVLPPDVQDHVARCAKCASTVEVSRFLQKGLAALRGKVTEAACPPSVAPGEEHTPNDPKRLGNYLILERLGEGGMGVVYKAFDVSCTRMVALKLIKPPYCSEPDYQKRFLAECRISAQLAHANIVQMLEQGNVNGRLFCAMEYIKGASLERLLATEGLLAATTAVRIASQVAAGLGEAHRQQVVHRDVKPSNILLEDSLERVKITDFGVMKDLSRETSVTQPGLLIGTLNFMAPEQVEGRPVTPATDVFAVGVILYQMLTGKLPFSDTTPTAVMRRIVEQPHRGLHEFGSLVPVPMRDIVDKCLAKDPAKRYQSGSDLAEALARCIDMAEGHGPEASHSNSHPGRLKRTLTILVSALVVLVGVTWLIVHAPGRAEPECARLTPTGRELDLLKEVETGKWRNLLPKRGTWKRADEGYEMVPVYGNAADFGWAYPWPADARKAEIVLDFRMAPVGGIEIVFEERTDILMDKGVALCHKWYRGMTVGDLYLRGNPGSVGTQAIPFPFPEGWHTLEVEAEPNRLSGRLDGGAPVEWRGKVNPKQIILSGDQFQDVVVRRFLVRFFR